MRKIAVIIGSKSDLAQCRGGLELIKEHINYNPGEIEVVGVFVRSQHRNTLETQELLKRLVELGVDVVIIGAGWANHLTGCSDAFLRYTLKNDRMVVIGVAFEGGNEERNKAAVLSITEVPGTQVVFEENKHVYFGAVGFVKACLFAMTGDLPKIKVPEVKPIMNFALEEALEVSKN